MTRLDEIKKTIGGLYIEKIELLEDYLGAYGTSDKIKRLTDINNDIKGLIKELRGIEKGLGLKIWTMKK